jgi:hypothetical protein
METDRASVNYYSMVWIEIMKLKRSMLYLGAFFLGLLLLFSRDALWQWTVPNPTPANVQVGTTFIKINAEHLGLDWRSAYREIINDIGIKQIRIPIFWDQLESKPGQFDWVDLDWQMQQAAAGNAKVVLVVGHRVPRYPECYAPGWSKSLDEVEFARSLFAMTTAVVTHFRNHPALDAWQVENEPLAKILGTIWGDGSCREIAHLVKSEVSLVKQLDPQHPTIVTYAFTPWPASQLRQTIDFKSDIVGITLFNKLFFRSPFFTGYIEMFKLGPLSPLRLAYQRSLVKQHHQDFWVAEMQAEPWGPKGPYEFDKPEDTYITMNPTRLRETWDYALQGGASRVYLWGAEWWLQERDRGRSAMLDAVKRLIR